MGVRVGILLCVVALASSMPLEQKQAPLDQFSGAEDKLPTPLAKQQLGNGMYELTLKALQPLKLEPHGTAGGMKSPAETTFMICQMYDISDLEPSHITQFTPLISKSADAPDDGTVVHHIDLFACDANAEGLYTRHGGRCDSFPDMPGRGGHFSMLKAKEALMQSCREFVYAYDRGAGAVTFPKDYGVRLGKDTPFKYIVMQRHILLRPNAPAFNEWSGVKMSLTTNLRPNNLGIAGTLDYSLALPRGHKSYVHNFTCPAQAVQTMFYPDNHGIKGIRPIAVHLHMHDMGKRMWVEIMRKDTAGKLNSVNVIAQDMAYGGYGPSENYHMVGPFTDEQLIQPGDSLRVHCDYDTRKARMAYTRYGIDWADEMCGPLFYYSPHDPMKTRPNAFACEGEWQYSY